MVFGWFLLTCFTRLNGHTFTSSRHGVWCLHSYYPLELNPLRGFFDIPVVFCLRYLNSVGTRVVNLDNL